MTAAQEFLALVKLAEQGDCDAVVMLPEANRRMWEEAETGSRHLWAYPPPGTLSEAMWHLSLSMAALRKAVAAEYLRFVAIFKKGLGD